MPSDSIAAEIIYTWKSFNLTKMVEYGVDFETLLADQSTLPPEGGRYDAYFEGDIEGPRLKGTVSCTDYIHVRGDGRIQLHIHGEITTDDGEKIALFADGISTHREGTNFYHNENVTLLTSSPKYSWVNELQIWANGYVDPVTGNVDITGYVG
jgi:hypothetical protein